MASRQTWCVLGASMLIGACQGIIGDKGRTPGAPPPSDPYGDNSAQLCAQQGPALRVGRTLLRRLTRAELDHTVRDLLGVPDNDPAAALAPDEKIGPFFSNGIAPITDLVVQQHQEVASSLALAAVPRMNAIAPCDLTADATDGCARRFIADFGLRAYRRPLDADEVDKYAALYALGRGDADAQNGFRMVLETMLQSPFFLYHVDAGASRAPSATPVPLTPYELASRLSYFLWGSMPDATLFQLAGSGQLSDPGMLRTQVARMLADGRAGDAVPSFHTQWLGIGDMSDVVKDPALFPSFDANMADAMVAETAAFSDYVVRRGDGLLGTLLTASFSFPQGPLFALYQIPQPAGFQAGDRVALDPTQRAGILTQPAFLASHAHRDQTSPVHRGLVVRENMLCQPIPAPPPDVNAAPLPPAAGQTTRDRFAAHESDPACGKCHQMMDPIGLGFENYDAIGAFRMTEAGLPIDASGEIMNAAADVAGRFDGVIQLGRRLAASSQVGNCVANQWFRFALGRMEANDDACALAAVHAAFQASGGNLRELITNIVLSDAFRNVRSVGTGQ